MFQGDLNTANVNPLLGALLRAHSHRLPCRCIPNTGRSTHRAHTRNPAKPASQGREKPPSRTAEPQEARRLISRIKLANTRFVHEPTW